MTLLRRQEPCLDDLRTLLMESADLEGVDADTGARGECAHA